NHLGESFLADFGNYSLWSPFFAESGKQQQRPCQPLFAGVEELVNQVFLKTNVTGQQVADENLRERFLIVEHPHHFFAVDPEYRGRRESCGGGHALRLDGRDALFSQKVSGVKDRYRGFLAAFGDDGQLHSPLLDIKHGIGIISLGKDGLVFLKLNHLPPQAVLCQEHLGFESRVTTVLSNSFHRSFFTVLNFTPSLISKTVQL